MTWFDKIRGSFETLHVPESDPSWFRYFGRVNLELKEEDVLWHDGKRTQKQVVVQEVREDGPDAWGCDITMEEGTFFRWDPEVNDAWYLCLKRHNVTVTSGGKSLECLYFDEDDSVCWTLYVFKAI